MAVKFANLASSTLASSLSSTATAISVTSSSSFPALGSGDHFYASIGEGTGSEIVKVTGVSSNTFTVVRGQDGTTAQSFSAGVVIALRVVAAALDDIASAADTESVSLSGDTMTGNLQIENTTPTIALEDTDVGSTNRSEIKNVNGQLRIVALGENSINLKTNNMSRLIVGSNGTFNFQNNNLNFVNTIKVGTGNVEVIDSSRNISAAAVTGSSFTTTGTRVVNVANSTLTMKGDTGGWAFGLHALGSSNTNHGGFGFFGVADALSYFYIGESYNHATNFRFYKSGILTQGTTTIIDASRNFFPNGMTTTSGVTIGGGLTTGTITVRAQNASGGVEGGEIRLQGATGDETINIDNYNGTFRVFDGSAPQVRLNLDTNGNATFAGAITTSSGVIVTDISSTGRGIYRNDTSYDLRVGGGTNSSNGAFISLSGQSRGGANNVNNGRIEYIAGGTGFANQAAVLGDHAFLARHAGGTATMMVLDSSTGDLDLKQGDLQINGTSVIDSSRNLQNINRLFFTSANTNVQGIYLSNQHRIYFNNQRAIEGNGTNLQIGEGFTGSVNIQADAGLQMNGTTVIDSNENATLHDITTDGVVRSTNNANADGPNFNVSTTNKDSADYAYRVDRSGSVVGGIRLDGRVNGQTIEVGGTTVLSSGRNLQNVVNATITGTATFPFVRLTGTGDASLSSTTHGIQVGATSGQNLIIDNNEVLSRNNGVASTLHLQADGGTVTVGAGTTANLTVSGSTTAGPIIATGAGTTNTTNALTVRRGNNADAFTVRDDGVVLVQQHYLYVNNTGGFYSLGAIRARGGITNDGGNPLSISSGASHINFNSKHLESVGNVQANLYRVGTTTVIDTNRNLVNILGLYGNGGTLNHYNTNHVFKSTTSNLQAQITDTGIGVGVSPQAVGAGNTTAGLSLYSDGRIFASKNSNTVISLNRNTSNGDMIELRRQGTTVGTISATDAGYIGVGAGSVYLGFYTDSSNNKQIIPMANGVGAAAANSIDLGMDNANHKFKDLYMSGSAFIGSTRLNAGSESAPSHSFFADFDTGMFRATTNQLGFSTAGSERMRIDSSGNFGIGTPSIGSSTKLQVAGRGLFTDGLPDPADGSPAGVAIGYNTTSGYGFIQAIQTGVANKDLYLQPSGANNVIIANSGGNVGIGNSSPSSFSGDGDNLVVGTTSGNNGISIISATDGSGNLYFGDTATTGGGSRRGQLVYDHGSDSMRFATAVTERMRIDSSGNVNIYGTDNRPLAITSFNTASAGAGWDLDATSVSGVVTVSTSGSERMRIDAAGNVGINTGGNTPAATLHTVANSGTTALLTVGASGNNIASFFTSGSSQVMTLDASGNLMVGKDVNNTFNEGFVAKAAGGANITSAGGTTLELNRRTSDGTVLNFRKDNSTFGSVGVINGDNLRIGGSVADHAGLQFALHEIVPMEANVDSDGTIDLGSLNSNFKDLHLSGRAYFSNDGDQYISGNAAANYLSLYAANQERLRIDSSGNIDAKTGGFQINGTTVIDSSRNLTNIGTGTFNGTITTTGGNLDLRNNTAGDGVTIRDINFMTTAAQGSDDRVAIIRAQNQSGGADSRGGKLVFFTRQANSANFNSITLDALGVLTVGNLNSNGAIQMGGTAVIDANRNATFTNLDIEANGTIELKDENGVKRGFLQAFANAPHFRISTSNAEQIGIYDGTTENIRINGSGDFNLRTGVLEINSTTVLDQSRNLTNIGTISSGGITTSSHIDFTASTALLRNQQDNSGQIGIQVKNSGGTAREVRWDAANNTNGAWRPTSNGGADLGLTNKIWNNLFVNTIKMGTGNVEVIDSARNISASSLTTSGDITVTGNQVFMHASNARVKFAVWSNDTYGIGMTNGVSFGGIGGSSSEYAMTFQMSNTATRGFVWLDTGHSTARGAMALTTEGQLTVANATRIGFGQSDTTPPNSATAMLDVNGDIQLGSATSNARLFIRKADDDQPDHINIFCGSTQTGQIGSQDTTWLRINQTVNKNIYTPRYIRADSGFFVDNTSTGLDGSGRLRAFAGSTSSVGIGFANDIDTGFYHAAANVIGIVAGGGERARIDSNGIELRSGKLLKASRADNTRDIRLFCDNSFGTLETTTDPIRIKSASYIRFDSGGSTHRMNLDTSGNLVVQGNVTAFGSPSDIRLKENIERIADPVEKVKKLDGVTFNYKKTGARSTGLIAQQLLDVLPEVVYEETDLESGERHYAVRYGQVVGLLVEAMKEQQDQIDSLKSIIEEMRNGNN